MRLRNSLKILKTLHREREYISRFLHYRAQEDPSYVGSVQPHELGFLEELVKRANDMPGPIVEVGALFGFTTQLMAHWKLPEKELIAIENFNWNPIGIPYVAHYTFTKRALFYVTENCHVTLFEGNNSAFYDSYRGPIPSMIFIDAGHEYEEVIIDIQWAVRNRVPLITGHDYIDTWPGIKKAVNETFGNEVKVVGSLWAHGV